MFVTDVLGCIDCSCLMRKMVVVIEKVSFWTAQDSSGLHMLVVNCTSKCIVQVGGQLCNLEAECVG